MNEFQMQENNWLRIGSNEEWEKVDDLIKGGHDGVVKDLQWSHGEYVDSERNMVFDGQPSIWLLIQLQHKPVSSVEFLLTGVEELHLNQKNELAISAEINENSVIFSLSHFADSRIKAREILYRLSDPPLLGNDSFTYF